MGFRKFFLIIGLVFALMHPAKSQYYGDRCACTRELSPICGSNGVTYQNGCLFDCAKQQNTISIRNYGDCIQISVYNRPVMESVKTCTCPYYLQPICANDGRTYSNQCEFSCAQKFNGNLQAVSGNPCYVQQQPQQQQPSFASAPQIPPLQQPAQQQQFAPQLPQVPPPQPLPPNTQVNTINGCACPFNFDPVCGNDARTYANECEFNCAKIYNVNLQLVARGKCNGIQPQLLPQTQPQQPQPQFQQQQPQFQPQFQQPQPQFQQPQSQFQQPQPQFQQPQPQFQQPQPQFQQPQTQFQPQAQIQPVMGQGNSCGCPFVVDYMCGSDGRTYTNGCELNCARRFNNNLRMHSRGKCNGSPGLALPAPMPAPAPAPVPMQPVPAPVAPPLPMGQPSACNCPYVLDEMCGSDGKTYPNGCELNCARRYNSNLRVHSKGKCQQMQNLPPAQPLQCGCPYNLDELCGNDGRTYSNQCEFNCAQRYNSNLGVVSRGRCNAQNQQTGWFTG